MKYVLTKKTNQVNEPQTNISPFHEPSTTRNNKKADGFINTSWMVISKKPKGIPQKYGAFNQLGHYRKSRRRLIIDKTMRIKDDQDYSQVVHVTTTSMIFINIERDCGKVGYKVSTTYVECECFPCEMAGTKRFWSFNAPFYAKYVHNVCFINVSCYEDEY